MFIQGIKEREILYILVFLTLMAGWTVPICFVEMHKSAQPVLQTAVAIVDRVGAGTLLAGVMTLVIVEGGMMLAEIYLKRREKVGRQKGRIEGRVEGRVETYKEMQQWYEKVKEEVNGDLPPLPPPPED